MRLYVQCTQLAAELLSDHNHVLCALLWTHLQRLEHLRVYSDPPRPLLPLHQPNSGQLVTLVHTYVSNLVGRQRQGRRRLLRLVWRVHLADAVHGRSSLSLLRLGPLLRQQARLCAHDLDATAGHG